GSTTRMTPARRFLDRSRTHLTDEYLPKIRRCLEGLSENETWYAPNKVSNSIGNLMLHLEGNLRQWILHGVAGAPDVRDREWEFRQYKTATKVELLARLEVVLKEVDAVLAGLTEDELLASRCIQGADVSVLDAVYHAVEHFSMHTGQIITLTKLISNRDLKFYRFEFDVAYRNW
ncbi:MAG: DUF1572 family protein, partial [Bacteroidota bacterium]